MHPNRIVSGIIEQLPVHWYPSLSPPSSPSSPSFSPCSLLLSFLVSHSIFSKYGLRFNAESGEWVVTTGSTACPAIVKRSLRREHEKSCPFALSPCPHHLRGCQFTGIVADLEARISSAFFLFLFLLFLRMVRSKVVLLRSIEAVHSSTRGAAGRDEEDCEGIYSFIFICIYIRNNLL